MDSKRFDALTRGFSLQRSRRDALKAFAAGVVGLGIARDASAQVTAEQARCGQRCSGDPQCNAGLRCSGTGSNSKCVRIRDSETRCDRNTDCPRNFEICRNGRCRNETVCTRCNVADDCPSDQACRNGNCGECTRDGQCRSRERCRRGRCERDRNNRDCNRNRDCRSQERCRGGRCEPRP